MKGMVRVIGTAIRTDDNEALLLIESDNKVFVCVACPNTGEGEDQTDFRTKKVTTLFLHLQDHLSDGFRTEAKVVRSLLDQAVEEAVLDAVYPKKSKPQGSGGGL